MSEPDDLEVLGVMVDGGLTVCNHAVRQWESGAYDLPGATEDANRQERTANVERWKKIRERVQQLGDSHL